MFWCLSREAEVSDEEDDQKQPRNLLDDSDEDEAMMDDVKSSYEMRQQRVRLLHPVTSSTNIATFLCRKSQTNMGMLP